MNCERCGKEVERVSSRQKYCAECRPIVRREQMTQNERNRRARLGEVYREYERQRYADNPESKKASKKDYYKRARQRTAFFEDLKRRARIAQNKYRDNALFGGNKELVFKRDGYECKVCGVKEPLCIHHIDGNGTTTPIEQRNNAIENLVTLCFSCHSKLHRELEKETGRWD